MLSGVYRVTVLRLPEFLWGLSSPPRVPPLFFRPRFVCLYCFLLLLSSPGHLHSSSWSSIGCSGVRFCSWGCYCSCGSSCCSNFVLSLCICSAFSACCGSGCSFQSSSAFFCLLRLWLLLPVFINISACCGSSCSFRFWCSSCCLP